MGDNGDGSRPPLPARTWVLLGVGMFVLLVAMRWGLSALGRIGHQGPVEVFGFSALSSLLTVGAMASVDRWLKKP